VIELIFLIELILLLQLLRLIWKFYWWGRAAETVFEGDLVFFDGNGRVRPATRGDIPIGVALEDGSIAVSGHIRVGSTAIGEPATRSDIPIGVALEDGSIAVSGHIRVGSTAIGEPIRSSK